MVQSLQLGTSNQSADEKGMKRLNRVPLFFGIGILVLFLAVLVYGLSSRGLRFGQHDPNESGSGTPASTFADQLKRGVKDGIIGDREEQQQPVFQPTPVPQQQEAARPVEAQPKVEPRDPRRSRMESDEEWNARMLREQREQIFREQQRQRMARLQASGAALDSPLKVDITDVSTQTPGAVSAAPGQSNSAPNGSQDLYAAALRAGAAGQVDQSGQASKEDFFNADIKELGYLPNQVVPQQSRYELKRGSIIPATLITGINSDLPGRITAQISQNVYDSATGHYTLVPQGTKLLGRYDSKVSFGQNRVLVVWTDIIFPNGSTLQIGGMAGTDSEGYGGFSDKVDNHYLRTFGSAALVALIGTGIDMSMPQSSTLATQDTASDAARRNFAETFGRVAEQTISKNLNVQPTIKIRPGFRFNVLVDQDIIFPGNYSN